MEVLKLFPLEVFSWDYEKHLMIPRSTEFQSNVDILNLEIYSDLKSYILECSEQIKKHYGFECDGFELTRSWLNTYSAKNNDGMQFHTHPMCAFAGVIFLSNSPQEPIIFKDPLSVRANQSTIPIGSTDLCYHSIPSVKNKILIFPWWAEHGVSSVNKNRISISFNLMPVGNVNYTDRLSKLNINYTK